MIRPAFAATALALLLTACSSGPGIPDTSYYRLPPRAALAAGPAALEAPLVIDAFFADGVHSDQSILYSTDPDGERIRAYHYQLWVDPPTRMLQRRLILGLDEAKIAPLVTERLPPKVDQYRLQARIEAFERIKRDQQWWVRFALHVRVDRSDADRPALLRRYQQELPAGGASVRDSIHTLGRAVDAVNAELLADLRQLAARHD